MKQSALGNDPEGLLAAQSVSGESPAIQCEDVIGLAFLPQGYQRGVRVVHRQIAILLHEICHSLQACFRGWNEQEGAPEKKFQARLLRQPRRADEMQCLSKDSLRCEDRARPSFQDGHTIRVSSLAAVN